MDDKKKRAEEKPPAIPDQLAKQVVAELVKELESAIEEEEGLDKTKPGIILDRFRATARKVPYTRGYLEEHFPMVEVVPAKTIPVTFQGICYQLFNGVKIKVPEPIAGIYYEHMESLRRQGANIPVVQGVVQVAPGAGALTSEEE